MKTLGKVLIFGGLLGMVGVIAYKLSKPSIDKMRAALIGYLTPSEVAQGTEKFNKMTDPEIADCYDFVFNYIKKNKTRSEMPADLITRITVISNKYNIFT